MPGDANYLADVQTQYDWQLALTRAISEYWRDPNGDFARVLLSGDSAAITNLFRTQLHYNLPDGLTLTFQEVDLAFIPDISVNGWAAGLNQLTATVIVKLPKAPKEQTLWPKAIADYVATGKAYPFT
jgi:ribosomally synthesized peptide (two-chain TOMM family)